MSFGERQSQTRGALAGCDLEESVPVEYRIVNEMSKEAIDKASLIRKKTAANDNDRKGTNDWDNDNHGNGTSDWGNGNTNSHSSNWTSPSLVFIAMARIRARAAARKGRPSLASKYQGNQPQSIQLENHPRPSSEIIETLSLQDPPTSVEDSLEPSPDPDQKQQTDRIAFWVKEGRWPEVPYWSRTTLEMDPTHARLLARKKSRSNQSPQSTSATFMTTTDLKSRGVKNTQYRGLHYELVLEANNCVMAESNLGITGTSKDLCRTLLEEKPEVPKDTLFSDEVFKLTCEKIRNKNEARIVQDITRLIVPSAETLATFGAKHLEILTESVNEGWKNSIPLTGSRPQPDYSVGFRRNAFTNDQLSKLLPYIGDIIGGDQSLFMATYYMYFPFLTCEVKRHGLVATADRQNAHSMTLAVRAIVELFRAVKREDEVHRQILAFSISHDDRHVNIYGHYPVINGEATMYYRHTIRGFGFIQMDGREKWTAYRFTKNVYDKWMPAHFNNICSAIDQLPSDPDSDAPARSGAAGLPQNLGNPMELDAGSASVPVERDS
ncbi:hypothetical protein DL769_011624 [Monosporascus sp. CRB-8-3]|nr:hypothetical protein DL769_011624 [Monosporascus sp. CRB-8-3]